MPPLDDAPDAALDAAMTKIDAELTAANPAAVPVETPPAEEKPAEEKPPVEEAPPEEEAPPAETPPAEEAPPAEPTADEKLAAIVAAAVAKAVAPPAKPAEPAKPVAPPEIKPPAHIARLIDSDDPDQKAAGEAWFEDWKESKAENAALRQRLDKREDDELEEGLAEELADALPLYTLGIGADGKPAALDPKDVDERVTKFAEDPETAQLCVMLADKGGMEAVLRYLYPEAVKKAKSPAPAPAGGPNHDGSNRNVRRVPGSPRTQPGPLARGGGNPTPPRPTGPSAPAKDEDMAACIDRAFRDLKLE